jgi:uncharacterized membrane protein YqjE
MQTSSPNVLHLGDATKRVAQRALVIFENRLQLLMVEAQEERERALLAIWLALGAAAFGLLAGVAITFTIAVALWEHSPIIALLMLTTLYSIAAALFYRRLVRLQQDWQTLPGTLDQLKKDRECLEKTFI